MNFLEILYILNEQYMVKQTSIGFYYYYRWYYVPVLCCKNWYGKIEGIYFWTIIIILVVYIPIMQLNTINLTPRTDKSNEFNETVQKRFAYNWLGPPPRALGSFQIKCWPDAWLYYGWYPLYQRCVALILHGGAEVLAAQGASVSRMTRGTLLKPTRTRAHRLKRTTNLESNPAYIWPM